MIFVAELRIVPIIPARLGELDTLFARADPRTCQCAFLRLTHSDYAHTSPAEHREVHHRAVRRAARAKRSAGFTVAATRRANATAGPQLITRRLVGPA